MTKRLRSLDRMMQRWQKAGDHDRSKFRAGATKRLILFWERVKAFRAWTPICALAPEYGSSERRWVRRNLYTLEVAGMVEIMPPDKPGTELYFRRKKGWSK